MFVNVANGKSVLIAGIGTVRFHGENGKLVELNECLFVPQLECNVISLSAVTAKGGVVVMENEQLDVYLHGIKVLESVAEDGLFSISAMPAEVAVNASLYVMGHRGSSDSVALWHQRLGHVGVHTLLVLSKHKLVAGLHLPSSASVSDLPMCDSCVLGKHSRTPFQAVNHRAVHCLDLVHSDLVGPMDEEALGGGLYALVVLDDATRYSEVRCLEAKSDAATALLEVIALWETRQERRLKVLRTDEGKEFDNHSLRMELKRKGVEHQMTTRYTPQSNGRAERVNRTLFECVRTLLVAAQCPKLLWDEALRTACAVRNIVSCGAGRSKTPYELFWGRKPDVSMLRVWGCTAFAKEPTEIRRKLDPKSTKGMLVGYSKNKKAWRVLVEPAYGEPYIVESRDCVFNEGEIGALPLCKDQAAQDFASLFLDCDDNSQSAGGVSEAAALPLGSQQRCNSQNEPTCPGISSAGDSGALSVAEAQNNGAIQEAQIPDTQESGPAAEASNVNNEEQDDSGSQISAGFEARYPRRARRAATTPYDDYINTMKLLSDEPASYEEVKARQDYSKWQSAMEDEYRSLVEQNTFEWVTPPSDCHAVPSRWVFVIKRDAAGNIEKYKARVVAKGFRQVHGRDYGEVYAPVSKHATMRALLAHVAAMDFELIQLDVKTAFLNGELEEEIYMKPPPGYEKTGKVWRLRKALYGLKQAARAWHHQLRSALKDFGFEPTAADPSLFVSRSKGSNGAVFVLTYVDDMLIAGSQQDATKVKQALMRKFKCHDLGPAKFFLGMSIIRDRVNRTLWLGQTKFSKGILDRFNFAGARPRRTPMDANLKLSMHGEDAEKSEIDQYPELIGCLLYLSGCTRPDIAQAVGTLSRFTATPKEEHVKAAKQLLKYIAGSTGMGIMFGKTKKPLEGYSDADYAGDVDKRRSTSGYVFRLYGGAISWRSKLQATVAASTCEAEFISASTAAKEALWLRQLMSVFTGKVKPVTIHVDNQGALALLHHPHGHQRTKHIDVAYKFVQDRVERGEIVCAYCPTNDMLADCLTKAVPVQKFVENRSAMGMQEAYPDNEDM